VGEGAREARRALPAGQAPPPRLLGRCSRAPTARGGEAAVARGGEAAVRYARRPQTTRTASWRGDSGCRSSSAVPRGRAPGATRGSSAVRSLLGHGTVFPTRAELEAGRTRQAIGVYDDLVARFGEATEPALREHVAKALFAPRSTTEDRGVARAWPLTRSTSGWEQRWERGGNESRPRVAFRVRSCHVEGAVFAGTFRSGWVSAQLGRPTTEPKVRGSNPLGRARQKRL
jgi:hypothetical protein